MGISTSTVLSISLTIQNHKQRKLISSSPEQLTTKEISRYSTQPKACHSPQTPSTNSYTNNYYPPPPPLFLSARLTAQCASCCRPRTRRRSRSGTQTSNLILAVRWAREFVAELEALLLMKLMRWMARRLVVRRALGRF